MGGIWRRMSPTWLMEVFMACRSSCPTQDHVSWGACARAADLRIGYAASAKGWDASTERRWDAELQSYRDARAAGVQPAGTSTREIRRAMDLSERAGSAFDASNNSFANGSLYSPRTDQIVSV